MLLYRLLAYICIFRIEELGFKKFRELALTQEPSKINVFVGYVFNKVSKSYCLLFFHQIKYHHIICYYIRKIYGILIVLHGWK